MYYLAIGNPLTYNVWTYTWDQPQDAARPALPVYAEGMNSPHRRGRGSAQAGAGRQLKQMVNGGTTLQFKYNDAGLRTQKINGATTTKYYWAGSKISHLTKSSDTLHFWYDAAGLPSMVTFNGTNYYYQHNLQGDIIGLTNTSGTQVVAYTYDSWGKQLSCTGSLAITLGTANPFRYRGYIYDEETGLYYLQSRYYNPVWGRFINADTKIGKSGVLFSHNIYTYCRNNPINLFDINGKEPEWYTKIKAAIDTEIAHVGAKLDEISCAVHDFAYDVTLTVSITYKTTVNYMAEYALYNVSNQLKQEYLYDDKQVPKVEKYKSEYKKVIKKVEKQKFIGDGSLGDETSVLTGLAGSALPGGALVMPVEEIYAAFTGTSITGNWVRREVDKSNTQLYYSACIKDKIAELKYRFGIWIDPWK